MLIIFKHKTAYAFRISDWSSDVGASDLDRVLVIVHFRFQCSNRLSPGLHAAVGLLALDTRHLARPFELRGEIGDLLLVGEQIAGNLQTLPACAQRDILARDLCSQSETRIVRIGLPRAELRARRPTFPSRRAEELNLPTPPPPPQEQATGFGPTPP